MSTEEVSVLLTCFTQLTCDLSDVCMLSADYKWSGCCIIPKTLISCYEINTVFQLRSLCYLVKQENAICLTLKTVTVYKLKQVS